MTPYEQQLETEFRELANRIRSNDLDLGRDIYAISLLHAVYQALLCNYRNITVIEFGVATGNGITDLAKASNWLADKFNIIINVVGFDTGSGLPAPVDYRDHPEMWAQGNYSMGAIELVKNLPDNTKLILGDVKDTVQEFTRTFADSVIGYVILDLDYYSSTKHAMEIFKMAPHLYLPGVPVHVDDMNSCLLFNPWCGASLAVNEFNQENTHRKLDYKHPGWHISNFHVLQVLDHPYRNGTPPPNQLGMAPL